MNALLADRPSGSVLAEPRPLRIAQLSTAAAGGGAEKVARSLHDAFRAAGQPAELWVGRPPRQPLPGVHVIEQASGAQADRALWHLADGLRGRAGRVPGAWRMARVVRGIALPAARAATRSGREDFEYPGIWGLTRLWGAQPPDVIHAHNLHGEYFDLRALPTLSQLAPLALTLHDQWLLTGHCAHDFNCGRWRSGCGDCPDLTIYPAIARDATAENWAAKRDLYRQSRLHVAAPSQWLLDRVAQSPLMEGVVERRLIRIGINRAVFHPGDRAAARHRLGLPQDAAVVMFAANGTRSNIWKDFATLEQAVERLPALLGERRVILLAVGQAGATRTVGGAEFRMLGFISDPATLADHYRAADLYLHATRADNSPIVVLEALACGTPVVASDVGGVPELVEPGRTGWLAPVGDAPAMAAQAARLLLDNEQRARFSAAATARIARDFDFDRQARAYLDWFCELADARRA